MIAYPRIISTRTVSRKCDNASRYGTPPIILLTTLQWARWRIRYFSRDAPNRWVVARTTLYNLCRDGTDTKITRHRTSNARSSLCWIPHAVDTRTTHLLCRVPFSVKRTLGVDDEWDALLVAVVPKFDPLFVLAQQSNSAIVDLLAVRCVRLQFLIRAEVMQASEKTKNYNSYLYFINKVGNYNNFFHILIFRVLTGRRNISCYCSW